MEKLDLGGPNIWIIEFVSNTQALSTASEFLHLTKQSLSAETAMPMASLQRETINKII